MLRTSRFTLPLIALALAACSTAESPAPVNTLVAARATAAPALDGNANDAAWAAAKPLTVKLSGGENFAKGETTATLKSVVVGDTIYFLVQYADPTNSVRRGPLQKQADGTWKKLVRSHQQGRRRERLLRRQVGNHLEQQQLDRRFQSAGLRRHLPRWRRQAFRQQVHRQGRRTGRHVAHEGQPHGTGRIG